MRLAMNKNGQVGRLVKSMGESAVVEAPKAGGRRGDLYLSTSSIKEDQKYWEEKAAVQRMAQIAQAKKEKERKEKQKKAEIKNREILLQRQRAGKYDATQEKLRGYFNRRAQMGEVAQMNADLNAGAGADYRINEEVNDPNFDKVISPRADFKAQALVGSPLTRDGVYGAVTDYDRLAYAEPWGAEGNATVVGGTMMGRHNGSDTMGDWWDSLSNFTSDLATNTVNQIAAQAPGAIASAATQELQNAINPPQTQTTIIRNITQAPAQAIEAANRMGVPTWALMVGLGGVAIGAGVLIYKVVKK